MGFSLVMFGASWCAPCKAVRPVVERVAQDTGTEYEYVDVESYDTRTSDIRSVPTLRVYDADGTVVREHTGGATAAQIQELVSPT